MPYLLPKASFLATLTMVCAAACIPAGDGVAPPSSRVYFPVGLEVSRVSDHLLVVNSDFDLQYSQGTIQSIDLEQVRRRIALPCSDDTECDEDQICDTEPSQENGRRPAYVCVDAGTRDPCGGLGEKAPEVRALAPGRCAPIHLEKPADGGEPLLTDVAQFSAFATQGILLSRPCGSKDALRTCGEEDGLDQRLEGAKGETYPERLFVPVRGDTSIHFIDVTQDGKLVCGRPLEGGDTSFRDADDEALRCNSDVHRVEKGSTLGLNAQGELVTTRQPPLPGEETEDEIDDDDPFFDFRVQPEPMEIGASASGRVVVVTHQVRGVVSTLFNDWLTRPRLVHVLRGLPSRPIGVASLLPSARPDGSFREESGQDFLVTYRTNAQVDQLHFDDDGLLEATLQSEWGSGRAETVFRPSMVRASSTAIITNSSGTHSRGLLVSATERNEALSSCGPSDEDCLAQAEGVPLDVYVTNRSPNSLLLGRTGGSDRLAGSDQLPRIYDNVPLTAGPARIDRGTVVVADGSTEERLFIICFDDGLIYVYDPKRRRIETQLRTGRGPYAMAFDPRRPIAYVAHFTDSYIGAISLDQSHPQTFGATLATLGLPDPPRAAGED